MRIRNLGRRDPVRRCRYKVVFTFAAIFGSLAAQNASAETKSFAYAWFYPATYTQKDNCPEGLNPNSGEIFRRALVTTGTKPEEADKIINDVLQSTSTNDRVAMRAMVQRGRFEGKPADAYINPLTVPDPGWKTATGRYAFGFNLDNKNDSGIDDQKHQFEDPETHEKGIDNQLIRVYGCLSNYQALPPERPTYPMHTWNAVLDAQPAWLISITSDDFSKDGDVAITFDRATTPQMRDVKGGARSFASFRVNERDPASNWVIKGKIKGGIVTAQTDNLLFRGDPFFLVDFPFTKVQLRIKLKADGKAEGFLGGYLPWLPLYFQHASFGLTSETMRGLDTVGLYYELARMADADPDPATGKNTRISSAWWMELVPVFVLPKDEERPQAAVPNIAPQKTAAR